MKILRVKKFNTFDVFFGEGWEDWTRFFFHEGKLVFVAGTKRTLHEIRLLTKTIKMNYAK